MEIIVSLVLYKHTFEDVKKTLNSLMNEDSINKVVLVDNGNYCTWLQDYNHEKLEKIFLDSNSGFGAGHNAALKRYCNSADYFLICNPDIHFDKGEIDNLLRFSKNNSVDLSIPKILYPDGTLQYGCKLLPTPWQLFLRRFLFSNSVRTNADYELHNADYSKPFFAPSLSGCCMFLSQKAVNLTQGFDTRFFLYLEDIDLTRRVCQAGLNVTFCPESTVFHEAQRRSYSDPKFLIYHLASAIKYFNKWGWLMDSDRDKYNRKCLQLLHKNAQKKR